MPGGEGIVLVALLAPAAMHAILMGVLLLCRAFRHRIAVYASIAIGACTHACAVWGLLLFVDLADSNRNGFGPGAWMFVLAALTVMAFSLVAPWLQYAALRDGRRMLQKTLAAAAGIGLALPVASWLCNEALSVHDRSQRFAMERLGRDAKSGDIAAYVASRGGDSLRTFETYDFVRALEGSEVLTSGAPLSEKDRQAVVRLLETADFGALRAKLIFDRHETCSDLMADPEAAGHAWWLQRFLETDSKERCCQHPDEPPSGSGLGLRFPICRQHPQEPHMAEAEG